MPTRKAEERLTAGLSMMATPVMLFLSTSNSLYLGNQGELDYQVGVLLPFLVCACVGCVVGAALYVRSEPLSFRLALFAYYLAGPFALAYSTLRGISPSVMDANATLTVLAFVYALCVTAAAKVQVRTAAKLFGLVGLAFVVSEAVIFMARFESAPASAPKLLEGRAGPEPSTRLPNLYHVVFDEYQTDLFELTRSPELEHALKGFTYFPDATTVFGRTTMALAATFTGRNYNYDGSQARYWWSAYNTPDSFLYSLLEAEYETYAFIHKPAHDFEQTYFHYRVPHSQFVPRAASADLSRTFRNLWIYRHFPHQVSERLIPSEDLQDLNERKLLPQTAPTISYASFTRYLEREESLSASNRYVLLHLLIPHFPIVLRPDCGHTFSEIGELEKTTPQDQTRCANLIIVDLVTRLKQLGRFEDALILVHGDHGSRYRREEDRLIPVQDLGLDSLEFSWGRSRVLLLVKPPGTGGDVDFAVSEAEVTLLDIAPTVLDALDLPIPDALEGHSLLDPDLPRSRGTRFYHWFDKLGRDELTDRLVRYTIAGGEIHRDRDINLTHFSSRGDVVLHIRGERDTIVLAFGGDAELVEGNDNRSPEIRIRATGRDPQLILPPFSEEMSHGVIVRIDLTSPHESTCQIFYTTAGETHYTEARSVRSKTRRGRNVMTLEIPTAGIAGRIRIDPGRAEGEYLIHEIEVHRRLK